MSAVLDRREPAATPASPITGLSAADLEDFFRLLPRIYADHRDPKRGPFRMAYLYANTLSNEDSMFLRAIELAEAGMIELLGISEGELGHGYEGFDHSVERLRQLGWDGTIPIVKIDVGGNVNTGAEARKLAQYTKNASFVRSWKGDGLAVIAPAFHLPRVFMTTVSALHHAELKLRVYPVAGMSLPWMEEAVHSQGTLKATRAKLLDGELQRLEKYRAPEYGGMLPPSEVLKYLDWRDSPA